MQKVSTTGSGRLILRSSLDELQRLTAWVEHIASEAALTAEQAFALQLCLEEAVANIVMYGGAAVDAPIAVEVSQAGGDLTVAIEDSARPFDPTQVPPREKPASLDQARVGALGVHLIRHYSSQMRYERRNGRNCLMLTFNRAGIPNIESGQ